MKVLAIILAGGKGTRLAPLVKDRCKPAVPFGGKFRIIDFVLSNCLNSGIRQVNVMVQYKSDSLQKHIRDAWSIFSTYLGEYIDVYPPQQRVGEYFYSGTADAVYQNLFTIYSEKPDYVLILSGDHIYQMDYTKMIEEHINNRADLTIASIPVNIDEGKSFGIIQMDEGKRVVKFHEKPKDPSPIPNNPDMALASMGIYVFSTDALIKRIEEDAKKDDTSHDFGKDIIPAMIKKERVFTYLFQDENKNPCYWRDVGTLYAYYQSNMDLLNDDCNFSITNPEWKYRTFQPPIPPAIIKGNVSDITNSLIASGCQIRGTISNSILGNNIIIGKNSTIENSVIFDDVVIGDNVKISDAIIDKKVRISNNINLSDDSISKQSAIVKENGLTILPKDFIL